MSLSRGIVLGTSGVFATCVGAPDFVRVGSSNAVPSGPMTTQTSLDACEATCVGSCLQYSWNQKSHHCFTSSSNTWSPIASDHIESGCFRSQVTGCPSGPAPTPGPSPPSPVPVPGGGGPFNSQWFANRKDTKLSASGDVLLWDAIQKPDTIITYLPAPFSLTKDGDKAEIKMAWESDGEDSCPSSDWAKHGFCKDDEPCLHKSVHCLAGTGDFRIGFLDSNGAGQVNASGWADTTSYSGVNKALESAPFSGYLGYSIRIDPHVSTQAEHYVPTASGSTAVPCSFNWNGLKHEGSALSKERLAYNGCFEAPAGKWTDLHFTIDRKSSTEAELTMSMNGVSYTYTHKMSSAEKVRFPKKIDTILIEYPNSRHYSYVKLAPYGATPPAVQLV